MHKNNKNTKQYIKNKIVGYGLAFLGFLGASTTKADAQEVPKDKIITPIDIPVDKTLVTSDSIIAEKEAFSIQENSAKLQDTQYNIIQEKNLKKAQEAFDELFVIIAYTEGFHSARYHCGARWTIGYGSTVLDNGARVTKYQKPIDMERGKEIVKYHVNNHVYPFLQYVDKELKKEQLLAVCNFIYNTGGGFFSGHDAKGRPYREPSNFLIAINSGADDYACASEMLQSHTSAGKVAWGLFKSRWTMGAFYTGKLKTADLLKFKPKGLYHVNNDVRMMYGYSDEDRRRITNYRLNPDYRKSAYKNFKMKFDDETIQWFKDFNKPEEDEKSMCMIVDSITINKVILSSRRDELSKSVLESKPEIIKMPPSALKIDNIKLQTR